MTASSRPGRALTCTVKPVRRGPPTRDASPGSSWRQLPDTGWCQSATDPSPSSVAGDLHVPSGLLPPQPDRWRLPRLGATITGVAAASVLLIATGAIAGAVARHPIRGAYQQAQLGATIDQVPIPSTPPSSLGGQRANPKAVSRNSQWQTEGANMASRSTVSFISVYGTYPPPSVPTARTFLVVGAKPVGGTGDLKQQAAQLISGTRSLSAKSPGSSVVDIPLQTSVLGGEIVCAGLTGKKGGIGVCVWESPATYVQVTTFTSNLSTVRDLTQRVVTELHR